VGNVKDICEVFFFRLYVPVIVFDTSVKIVSASHLCRKRSSRRRCHQNIMPQYAESEMMMEFKHIIDCTEVNAKTAVKLSIKAEC
jgi:hypothetical protein